MENWIAMRDRKPEEDDRDEYGCVIAWHVYQGVMVTGWKNAVNGSFFTHWMHTPKAPENAKEAYAEYERMITGTKFPE